ncbi:hypothetical protein SUGI_1115620 [Cryptomeria japonica]|nr:hypothetical protein SUGI_1115620 [Cryptomeria japonica]
MLQMYCGVVVRFVISLCLMGFTAAKCVPEMCGSMKVSYSFWLQNSHCGFPGFQINCTKDEDGMMSPKLLTERGQDYSDLSPVYYKILDINYMGHLVINSTSLKAQSCTDNTSKVELLQLPVNGPFAISMSNKFVVIGCNTIGTYRYNDWGEARCVSTCVSQINPPYCRYGCGEMTLPDNWKWLNFSGGGIFRLNEFAGRLCGFSTMLDPSTFKVVDNTTNLFWGKGRKAHYGLRLNWGVSLQNCSMAKATVNYSCSSKAECIDSPSGKGHVCKCLPGYEGNGYSNGTDCTDIDECSDKLMNKCFGTEGGGICLNLPGSYNCSCAKGYEGDGYSSGTNCKDIDECSHTNMNMCVEEKEGGMCRNLAGSYSCSCAKGYKGDGFRNGTRCKPERSNKTVMFAAIGSVFAFIGVSLGVGALVWWLTMRYQKHAREGNFRCNGGILLKKILAQAKQTDVKKFRIFSEDELKRASQNYSMKLGKGGSSMVYKGILPDGKTVAIKKFKEFHDGVEDEEFMEPFINEIVLSGVLITKTS